MRSSTRADLPIQEASDRATDAMQERLSRRLGAAHAPVYPTPLLRTAVSALIDALHCGYDPMARGGHNPEKNDKSREAVDTDLLLKFDPVDPADLSILYFQVHTQASE
jgi:hypothetical protein